MNTEINHIESALQLYFDGLYDGNVEMLARVFHPQASLFIESESALVTVPVPEWLQRVASRASPVSQGLARHDQILMIDRVGPVNALAKVTCMVAPKVYVDYLSLIKVEGRWQIVAKAYCQTN